MKIEYLAIPAWQTPPTPLDAWVVQLSEHAGPVIVSREGSNAAWLEIAPIRLRAYVQIENGHASAINFELNDPDPDPASRAIEASASALGWEVYADDDEDGDEDEDED